MSWVALAVGAGAGVLKAEAVDAPKADRQRKLAASTQRFSPWTGLKANPVQEADPFGSALQYGATGAQMRVGMNNAANQADLAKAQAGLANQQSAWLKAGGSPQYTAAMSETSGGPAGMQAAGSSWPGGPLAYSSPWARSAF